MSSLANEMRISGVVNLKFIYDKSKFYYTQQCMHNVYTNTGNHVTRGSLSSDTVITKIPTVSTSQHRN